MKKQPAMPSKSISLTVLSSALLLLFCAMLAAERSNSLALSLDGSTLYASLKQSKEDMKI